jgi:hypothetical protein
MKGILGISLFAALLYFAMNGCNKKSNAAETKTQLITASPWVYDTAGIDLAGNGTIDEALPDTTIPVCVKDNTLTFTSDSTGVETQGAVRCDSTGPLTSDFTWSFNAAQTQINFPDSVFGSFGGTVSITSLTATQLHLEKAVTESGITVNIAIYLKH